LEGLENAPDYDSFGPPSSIDRTSAESMTPKLPDASRWIRLLRLDLQHSSSVALSATLTAHPIDSKPEYVAVSYTWGRARHGRWILMNGLYHLIGEKCHHALAKLLRRRYSGHIWVDCLSVDQSNDREKSQQVAMMSNIFGGAHQVFICLGPIVDAPGCNVAVVRKELRDMPASTEGIMWPSDPVGLSRALYLLSTQDYGTRLSIVQEIMAANSTCALLLDADMLDLHDIQNLLEKFVSQRGSIGFYGKALREIKGSRMSLICTSKRHIISLPSPGLLPAQTDLYTVLSLYDSSKCSDPRDRVFGTMSFITWPERVPPPSVDYSITSRQLARKLFLYYEPAHCNGIFQYAMAISSALELSLSAHWNLKLIKIRHQDIPTDEIQMGGTQLFSSKVKWFAIKSADFTRQGFANNERLPAYGPYGDSQAEFDEFYKLILTGRRDKINWVRRAKCIVGPTNDVWQPSRSVLPGDILAVPVNDQTGIGFVLHPFSSSSFENLYQAICPAVKVGGDLAQRFIDEKRSLPRWQHDSCIDLRGEGLLDWASELNWLLQYQGEEDKRWRPLQFPYLN
jgi:hypothetical protein